ncbi:MAG: histidine phosphatase family protein [Acidimicrobiales bacterium]
MSDTAEPGTQRARPMSAMDQAFLTDDDQAGEVILVRHGQQQFPEAGTKDFSAWIDPPLSKVGMRQAEAVGRHLSRRPVTAVYSSRLERAYVTGQAIAEHHGLDVVIDDRLREIEMFRDLPDGKTNPVEAFGAEQMAAAQEEFIVTRQWSAYPGTETTAELRGRVVEAVEAIVSAHPAQVVVVACHGGVINAYLADLLGLTEDMFFRPAHTSLHRIRFHDERRVIDSLNETAHLEPADELLTS